MKHKLHCIFFLVLLMTLLMSTVAFADTNSVYIGYPVVDDQGNFILDYLKEVQDGDTYYWTPNLYLIAEPQEGQELTLDTVTYGIHDKPYGNPEARINDKVCGIYELSKAKSYTLNNKTITLTAPSFLCIRSTGSKLREFDYDILTSTEEKWDNVNRHSRVFALQSDDLEDKIYTGAYAQQDAVGATYVGKTRKTWDASFTFGEHNLEVVPTGAYSVETGRLYYGFNNLISHPGDINSIITIPTDDPVNPIIIDVPQNEPTTYYDPEIVTYPNLYYIPIGQCNVGFEDLSSSQHWNDWVGSVQFDERVQIKSVSVDNIDITNQSDIKWDNLNSLGVGKHVVYLTYMTKWSQPCTYNYEIYLYELEQPIEPRTRGDVMQVDTIVRDMSSVINTNHTFQNKPIVSTSANGMSISNNTINTDAKIVVKYVTTFDETQSEPTEKSTESVPIEDSTITTTKINGTNYYYNSGIEFKDQNGNLVYYPYWPAEMYKLSGLTDKDNVEQIIDPIDQLGTD